MIRFFLILSVFCPALWLVRADPLPGLRRAAGDESAPAKPAASAAPDVPALQKKAESGDAGARVELAGLILSGAVRGATPADAAGWLEKAAESGDGAGALALSRLLRTGADGVKADAERSGFLLQQAAESGYVPAQTAWGSYLLSRIDPKARDADCTEAVAWFRKAADAGDPEGMCRLGMLQAIGEGMPADPVAAWQLISKAAKARHPLALNEAGICLQTGRGVESDPTAAVGYFYAASELGNGEAVINLADCYRMGKGIPRNYAKAGSILAPAAKANFGPAQFILGEMFEKGEGTPPNAVFAAVNYLRAAANGVPAGNDRFAAIKSRLTPEQLKELQKELDGPVPAKPGPKKAG